MSISFACSCGKRLIVKDDRAGKRMACPACERELTVPAVEARDRAARDHAESGESPRPRRRKKERAKEKRPALWPWLVGGGVGVAALLALIAIPLVFFLGRSSPNTGRQAKEGASAASAQPAKAAVPSPAKPLVGPQPAALNKPVPFTSPTAAPPVSKPENKPATEKQPPRDALTARLLRFGPAQLVEADVRGSTFAGAVIELESAVSERKARCEVSSITATDKEGKPVSAAVLFIAGGRDGFGPTANVLAGTTAEAFEVSIGKSRFTPGPFPPAMRALRNVKTGDVPSTAQVNPRLNDFVINVTDLMLVMPLVLSKGGGVEYTLLANRKVQLGVVFAADADKLTDIKLLGLSVPIDRAKLEDSPLPGAPIARGPNVPPMLPAPGVPNPATAPPMNDPAETTGLWSVKADGGEPSLLLDDVNCHAVAISRDLKQRALFRNPTEGGAAAKLGAAGDQLAVGPMDKPLHVIWTSNGRTLNMPGTTSLYWSASGQHLLLTTFTSFAVLDLKGKARGFGDGTALAPLAGTNLLESPGARWAGRSDSEVAVLALSPPRRLVVLNVATGRPRDLCPTPPSVGRIAFRLSDDQRTAAFFVPDSKKGEPERNAGVWVWRRGQKAPVRLGTGNAETGTLSADGKYLAAVVEQAGKRQCVLYQVADKKELWTADCAASDLAFDPAGKRLAISTGKDRQLLVTPIDKFAPTEVVKSKSRFFDELAWSADGQEIIFHRMRQPRPTVFRP
jgi:hypothetical protein